MSAQAAAIETPLIERVAGSAARLVARFGVITLVSGVVTIALTRTFGPHGFGPYASAVATWSLLGAIADFGLTPMLSRDTARLEGPPSPETYRSAYKFALLWCTVLAGVEATAACSAGISTTRGEILLILIPGTLFNCLNPARTVFLVIYRTGLLLTVDVLTTLVQAAATLALLAIGFGPVAIAVVLVTGSIVNNLIVAWYAERLLADVIDPGMRPREVIRRAAPLAILSVLNQVYFTIDLVLLGWLVHGPRLGDYAAASKLLQLLAAVSGLVVSGSLPALAATARAGGSLERLVARIWHWLLIAIIPVFITLAVAAPVVIDVMFSSRYAAAAPLLRILCFAGIISPICNIAGSVQAALVKTRRMLRQNLIAAVFNVTGNLILIPRYGVIAAAWMTFATEMLIGSMSVWTLRHELGLPRLGRVSARPAGALAAMLVVELAFGLPPGSAAVLGGATFIALVTVLRAWPPEFQTLARRLVKIPAA